ncbi:MAG: hypothetical protein HN350_05255 [Phycisphaerales bacterium]|jgi:hypothetical protein|nr:hypothetical protein [Phycisphaerales bacterium]
MIDREHAIQTTLEDMNARVRLSSIRKDLQNAGFSPEETHEIITAAIEHRKASRKQSEESGQGAAVAVFGLGFAVLIITFMMARSGGVYIIPGGLFVYGAYLWYGKPSG